VSIGEALAQARRQSGLSLTQVSQQTRIRETIIAGLEADDYSACGGDFYARGHIRAVARVVGIDSEPLIEEYDAVRLGPPEDAEEETSPQKPVRERRRWGRSLPLWVLLVAVVTLGAYHFLGGSGAPGRSAAAGRSHQVTRTRSARADGAARPAASGSARPSHSAQPVAAATPAVALVPASATSFGSGGAGQGDNNAMAHLAIGSKAGSGWQTDWYTTATFGGLYQGTGLLIDMGRPVTVTQARITLGSARGATFELRVGDTPTLASLSPAATASHASGVVTLELTHPAQGRYVLVWFTTLPQDSAGTYQASVDNIQLTGHS
jgi:hypothetical protein